MRRAVASVLEGLELGADGIYSAAIPAASDQTDELGFREAVARREHADLLGLIGRHHSIPVMDRELRQFLRGVPPDGVVADIGGGWGWHWRCLNAERPDVCVVIVDFVRENLRQAVRLLGPLCGDQVFLVHGDAGQLPFPSSTFDAYWFVQALQHIPRFEEAVKEAHRILKPGGQFASYSLNHQKLLALVYRLVGRSYHVRGNRPGSFYLARGAARDGRIVEQVFQTPVSTRFTEVLFHPDLRIQTGGITSRVGAIDACLSTSVPWAAWFARQRSFHARKSL